MTDLLAANRTYHVAQNPLCFTSSEPWSKSPKELHARQ